ncbi:ER lumen retaining receptor isoform B [Chlorella sorokiniana]|uniref:ER lumen retaining receptor isoform B n=1 Tax=Chlorella sorokiniana TaxID=3076 RepID=A0A2P6TW29_CHLSO|nr:ER lumen retaining receptor isoform B [Chlorella sorokiniana]|eukprot:PRW58273.1 ER lumen retaining receptor isoform B [Chlorella sorokiniana]
MGRVVSEQRVALQFDTQLNQGLVRSAAARESGLDYDEFEARLQRLFTLVPFLQERMLRMQPKLLAALAAEPEQLAQRLVELKTLLPQADVAAIVAQRPSLLLDGEWERVPAGVAALAACYSEEEAGRLASAEPLLLVEDLEHVLQELGRLMGGSGDAAAMLLRDPSMVYSVQRGSRSLGPGAEF